MAWMESHGGGSQWVQVGVRAGEGSGDRYAAADRGCLDVRGPVKINLSPNKKRGY